MFHFSLFFFVLTGGTILFLRELLVFEVYKRGGNRRPSSLTSGSETKLLSLHHNSQTNFELSCLDLKEVG